MSAMEITVPFLLLHEQRHAEVTQGIREAKSYTCRSYSLCKVGDEHPGDPWVSEASLYSV